MAPAKEGEIEGLDKRDNREMRGQTMAGVGGTGVVQMAEETRFAGRALAVEGAHSVVTGGPIETGGGRTVVDIVGTGHSCPPIDTNAREGAQGVDTSGAVLTHVRSDRTLVHIARTVRTRPLRRTLTRVGVDGVHTRGSVLTQVSAAVVDVVFAVLSGEAYRALTRVTQSLVMRNTMTAIETPVVLTGNVSLVAVLSSEASMTVALKAAHCVETNAVSAADITGLLALVHVLSAVLSTEAEHTLTHIRLLSRMTLRAIPALVAHTVVPLLTRDTCPAGRALALEVLQRVLELTLAVVETGVGVAD